MSIEQGTSDPLDTFMAIVEFEARSGSSDGCYDPIDDGDIFDHSIDTGERMLFEPTPDGFKLSYIVPISAEAS